MNRHQVEKVKQDSVGSQRAARRARKQAANACEKPVAVAPNVRVCVVDNKLRIEVDLDRELGFSQSGNMKNIAHAHWTGIPGIPGLLLHMHVGEMI